MESNTTKSGRSLILLLIVIIIMSGAIFLVSRLFNNSGNDKIQEEAFKLNVYSYCIQVNEYISKMQEENSGFVIEELDACGTDLKGIIPDIKEKDLSKFKIVDGKIVYIGVNEDEAKWTSEVI